MIPGWFVAVSVLIRLVGGGRYAWGIIKGKARPNPVTWLLWAATSFIALIAQLPQGLTAQSAVLLALFVSPALVFLLAVIKQGFRRYLTPFTVGCAAIALAGIVLWRLTAHPEIAIAFAIVADIAATLPTLLKSYRDPSSEYALPYLLSAASMIITLLTIAPAEWVFTVYAFPAYMLCVNLVLASFAHFPLRRLRLGLPAARVRLPSAPAAVLEELAD